jgi:hypothetical protein
MRDKDGKLVVDLPPKNIDVQVLNFEIRTADLQAAGGPRQEEVH